MKNTIIRASILGALAGVLYAGLPFLGFKRELTNQEIYAIAQGGPTDFSLVPFPTTSTLGGVVAASAPINQFMIGIGTNGYPIFAQPAASNISGLATSAVIDTTNAANIVSGTLGLARLPTIPTTQISGLAPSATTDTTNASNITSGALNNLSIGGTTPAAGNFSSFSVNGQVAIRMVAPCDGSTDITASVNAALSAAAIAGVTLVTAPYGNCVLSSNVHLPNHTSLSGQGKGDSSPGVSLPAATTFTWNGASAGNMFTVGAAAVGTNYVDSALRNMSINGNGLAASNVIVKDLNDSTFENIDVYGFTVAGIIETNSTNSGAQFPTGFNVFRKVSGTAPVSGSVLDCTGVGTGAEGITNSNYYDFHAFHYNGAGVEVGLRCDNQAFYSPYTYRPTVGGYYGFGLQTTSTDPAQVISGWYIANPLFNAGIYIAQPNSANGWVIDHLYDSTDVSATPANVIYGPGKFDVSVPTSFTSKQRGPARVGGFLDAARQDAMKFVRFDSVNNILFTAQGAWNTAGTVTDAGAPGGVTITTAAATNSVGYVLEGALGNGVPYTQNPQAAFIWNPVSPSVNALSRIGYFTDLTDPPNNGAYIEVPAGSSSVYNCVSVSSGTKTSTAITALAGNTAAVQFRIEVDAAGRVTCLYRVNGYYTWALGATITTNIPTTYLTFGAWVKTLAVLSESITFADFRRAYDTQF